LPISAAPDPWACIVSRFYNDLPLHINTQVDLFADDTTLLAVTDFNDINELKGYSNIFFYYFIWKNF
jgi:hypothetical protein